VKALLGIDLGTSGLKAVLFDTKGRQLARGYSANRYLTGSGSSAEQDPETWWQGCCRAVGSALRDAGIAPEQVAGIGVCGFHHCPVFLNNKGKPVRASIVTHDPRLEKSLDDLKARGVVQRVKELTGSRVTAGHFPVIYHHVRTHEKHVLDATSHILLAKDYLRYKLTGTIGTELCDATGTHLVGMPGDSWSAELCELLEVPMSKLPGIGQSSRIDAGLSREAAGATGLHPDTPVVYGGGDSHCALLGLGAVRDMQIGLLLGTNSTLRLVFREFQRLSEPPVWIQRHVVPGQFTASASSMAGAAALSWFRDMLLDPGAGTRSGTGGYEELDALAAAVEPGSDGLLFLPYIYGERSPFYNLKARGSFLSFGHHHGRGHFVRSVMEGVAFATANNLEVLLHLPWASEDRMAAVRTGLGGGSLLGSWRRILANALGRPLEVMQIREPGCLGAGLLAGLGLGLYPSASAAVSEAVRSHSVVHPQPEVNALYLERRRLFNQTYQALEPILYS
jgi:xylulokinase